MHDVIIIGGGIAGLYAAYKLKRLDPRLNFILLEKGSIIGGRMGLEPFQGTMVTKGAGVGRKHKDKLLIKLLNDLQIPYREFTSNRQYSRTIAPPPCDVAKTFSALQKKYKQNTENYKNKTFQDFAVAILGKDEYSRFTTCAGFKDYENADVTDVLYNYGFDDNFTVWTGLGINWNDLVKSLIKYIGKNHTITNSEVIRLKKISEGFMINTSDKTYTTKQVILATTIDSVLRLMPAKLHGLYSQIRGQPFIRIYGKFDAKSRAIIQEYIITQTVVPGPLYKIIPMDREKGVYMIAYSDNKGAKDLHKYSENTVKNREILCRILEQSLGLIEDTLTLLAIKSFYWSIGTHYYSPIRDLEHFPDRRAFIRAAQYPIPGLYIVGEMVALDQGWVEGALESVENIIPACKQKTKVDRL